MGAYRCGMEAARTVEQAAEHIGHLAYKAMIEEVTTTPKPGLVDCYSNGAHADMDFYTFKRSALALKPYFRRMAYEGMVMANAPRLLFSSIRKTGIMAEAAMYQATNGVNTHKGIIFHIGILSAAAGACLKNRGILDITSMMEMEQSMVAAPLTHEVEAISRNGADGDRILYRYGMAGARGEARDGYPLVFKAALPMMVRGLNEGREWNRIKLQTLFALMECVEDSNIVSRHDPSVLLQVQEMAGKFLETGGAYQENAVSKLQDMDCEFIRRNLSPGGCADLLAVTIFIAELTSGKLLIEL